MRYKLISRMEYFFYEFYTRYLTVDETLDKAPENIPATNNPLTPDKCPRAGRNKQDIKYMSSLEIHTKIIQLTI